MPVGFATSPTTGQGFCFIAASWIWVGLEEKITVKLTKSPTFIGLAERRRHVQRIRAKRKLG
jgi:hypothetical protein